MLHVLAALLCTAALVAHSPIAQAPAHQHPAAPAKSPDANPSAYDPLQVETAGLPEALDLTVEDAGRKRAIPLRVQLPAATAKAPVVLCSHGLGGTRETCTYLATHWAARGYVAVFLQHPGSDDSVWRGTPLRGRMAAMKKAASGQNLVLRCGDVTAVLDQLAVWNGTADHPLCGRLDLEHIGMSGHSFGAVTTQGTAGQTMPLVGQRFTDARIDAAMPMSPSMPGKAEAAFQKVAVPWLLMTGTEDVSAIGDTTVEERLAVYPALPASIDRYELVLHGASHSAFTERGLPGERHARNPNHHRAILALSTAFWDTHLRSDDAARTWLHGDGPRTVLEEQDRWQHAHPEPATVR